MPPPVLATVYAVPARSFRIPTTPGRDVVVYAGEAKVRDPKDMPFVLRRDDVSVEVPADKMDWLPEWLNACGEHHPPKANLTLPEGFKLGVSKGKFYLKERPPFLTEDGALSEPDKPSGWMFPSE